MLKIDEIRLGVKPLERGVFVVAVDGAVNVAAILEILDEVHGEEALADPAFAVDDEVDLFAHKNGGWLEIAWIGDARAADA